MNTLATGFLLIVMAGLHSCALFQKHPPIIYSGGEGRLDWVCWEYKAMAGEIREFRDNKCRHIAWYQPDGNIDSTYSYTKSGRLEQRTRFAYDPIDRVWVGESFDSTGLLLYRNITRLDSLGREVYNMQINHITYRDSGWFDGENFIYRYAPVAKTIPDTTEYYSQWIYAGKKLTAETKVHEQKMLIGEGWNNTMCLIYIFRDTLLVKTSRTIPVSKNDPPSDSMVFRFGNGLTPDTISFLDPRGVIQERYTVHHNEKGRPIAITCEYCPANGDMCPPTTNYFFYDDSGNIIEQREAYNCNSPVCPRKARRVSETKYDKAGNVVEFCCYSNIKE